MRNAVLIPFVLVALVGCAGDDGGTSATEPAATVTVEVTMTAPEPTTADLTPSDTPTVTPTQTQTPESKSGVVVTYKCEGMTYYSMEEAWEGEHPNCIDTKATGTPSKREIAALRLAYGPNTKISASRAAILYGGCGSNNRWWPVYSKNDTMSAEWAQEQIGQNLLCPNHPHMDQARRAIQRSLKQAELDKNRIQYDGTYVVSKELNPGTYVAFPDGGGCYWERTDANGEIIDNNFSNGARVEFTIQPSDYSVSVAGCGEWRQAN